MFALLFDETTAESFTATQALNPGFFFKEAADYAKKRKISAYNVCQVINPKNILHARLNIKASTILFMFYFIVKLYKYKFLVLNCFFFLY